MSNAEAWAAWVQRKLQVADQGQQPAPRPGPGQQAFTQHQGNSERIKPAVAASGTGTSARRGDSSRRHSGDESHPRKPSDPPWRGRTARRTSTPKAMAAFRDARLRRGWSLTRAAKETGVSRPHLSLLERGLRRPSESVAEAVITGYRMTDAEADAVSAIAVPWAGRDSPYRTGEAPDEW